MRTDIDVVIVNWNAASVLRACLDSVLRQQIDGDLRVIVVDNASSDDSVDLIRGYDDDRLVLIASPENLGFGRGNNVGFEQATGTYSVFLNPDTELLGDDVLTRLVAPLRDPAVGIVGPHLVNPDGSTQNSCAGLPSIPSLLALTLGIPRLLPDRLRRRFAPVIWSHDQSTDTGWLNGACLAMRGEDFRRLGGFSESTFMYGEDLELSYKVHRAGLRVRYEHSVDVMHIRDVSSQQRWSDGETAAKIAYGDLVFYRDRYSAPLARVAQLLMLVAYGGRAAVLRTVGRHERAAVYAGMARTARTGRL